MHLLEQVIAGFSIYLVFNSFGAIGLAVWTLAGRREIGPIHMVTGKVLGLAILATLLWWGTIAGVFPYAASGAVAAAWMSVLALSVWWLVRETRLRRLAWPNLRVVLRTEGVAIGLLVGYLVFRAAFPQLDSTEKFMDLALLSGAVRTDSFPFADFWRADMAMNYYYFGYIPLALLLRLTDIAEPLGYNLLLALLFVTSLQLSYGIVRELTRSHLAGLLGAGLAMLGGNLHFAACMVSTAAEGLAPEAHCPYPKATRLLDPSYTINEMPSYSFFLGDLHPHVISIPFFLTSLFLLWCLSTSTRWNWGLAGLIVYSLAVNAVIHAWDFITLGALLGILVVLGGMLEIVERGQVWRAVLIRRTAFLMLAASGPFILFWSFFAHFDSPVTGIGFAPSFVVLAELQGRAQYPSGAVFLLLFWGGLVVPALAAVIMLGGRRIGLASSLRFSAALSLVGLLLVVFAELFFFRDLYHVVNPPYFRANTVFKFGFHAWMLLAMASAVLVHAAWSVRPLKAFAGLCVVCFGASALFPLEAFRQLSRPGLPGSIAFERLTLDGGKFISLRSPEDAEAIRWLRENEHGRVVVLEAYGDSYSYAGRVGVFSGAVNVANWPVHQWTWRFRYPDDAEDWHAARERVNDTGLAAVDHIGQRIRELYEGRESACDRLIVRELGADYLYVGDLERATYPDLDDTRLRGLGDVVFERSDSYLVRLDRTVETETGVCR